MDYTVTLSDDEARFVRQRIDYVLAKIEEELTLAGEEVGLELSAEHRAWIQIQKVLVP
jgi:hypothetical protein